MRAEVCSDGRTVWVNGSDGMCLGRFSHTGLDVHKDYAGQQKGGQCLDCKPGPLGLDDWQRFKEGMAGFYGVNVADRHAPKFIKAIQRKL